MSATLEALQAQLNVERGNNAPPPSADAVARGEYDHTLSLIAAESALMKSQQPAAATPYLMSLQPSSVHIDSALSNMAVMYRNREYVADRVLPVIPVPKRSDKYFTWNQETMFQTAKVNIAGNRGRPGEVTYGISSASYSVTDYGLLDFVSYDEINNADAPLDPQRSSVEITTNYLLLAREDRVSSLVFSNSNYGSNHSSLTGAAMWDQPTSDPVNDIETAIENCLVRPNALVIGVQAWIKLRQHPKLTQFIISRAQAGGQATPLRVTAEMVAEAFELDQVIVGRSKKLTSAEGLSKTYGYVWGKSAALIKITAAPDKRQTDTFGYTFRYSGDGKAVPGVEGPSAGGWEVRQIPDYMPGVRGGVWNKISHSDTELGIATSNAGYLYETVVA